MHKKKALIIGITGQDGSYLAEFLLKKKYKVHAILRSGKKKNQFWRIRHIKTNIVFYKINLTDLKKLTNLIKKLKPNEIYHLGSQGLDYKLGKNNNSTNPNIVGTKNILSIIREHTPETKFYFAASSEIYGNIKNSPQDEKTKFNPNSAYAISKVKGLELTKKFREKYNLYACTGILYNHESPRRGKYFVTKKIASSVARIYLGKDKEIELGSINSRRDWGHAKDYVITMWKMLQLNKAQDFVIGSGKQHSVSDFLKIAFTTINLNYKLYIKQNKLLIRKQDVNNLKANNFKARKILKWKPRISFKNLVNEMVKHEIKLLKKNI